VWKTGRIKGRLNSETRKTRGRLETVKAWWPRGYGGFIKDSPQAGLNKLIYLVYFKVSKPVSMMSHYLAAQHNMAESSIINHGRQGVFSELL